MTNPVDVEKSFDKSYTYSCKKKKIPAKDTL